MASKLPNAKDETVELPVGDPPRRGRPEPDGADAEPAPPYEPTHSELIAETAIAQADGTAPLTAESTSREPMSFESRRYRVVREIGRGGMGVVLEAQDTKLNRRVALKVLLAGDFASEGAVERFQVEARSAARLTHRNLVAVHEVGEEGGRHFLVMDYVRGESLAERIKREGALDPRQAAWFTLRLADALYYAHTRAILHRDVKPANVLIDAEGEPLLADFGLAKELDSAGPALTASGFVVGTPAYMSPEQAQGASDLLDRRSDIYALGATLYEMLSGRPPFVGPNVAALLRQVLEKEPARIEGLDRDLETICLKCLEKEPAMRYGSARALQEDLERYLAHESILARPPGPVERGRKWLARNRRLAHVLLGSLTLSLLVLAGVTAGFLRQLQRERDAARKLSARTAQALDTLIFKVREDLADLPGERVRRVRKDLLREALDQLLQLGAGQSEAGAFRTGFALRELAQLALDAGELEMALDKAREALAVASKGDPESPETQRNVGLCYVTLCDVQARLGRLDAAGESIREALAVLATAKPLRGGEGPDEALKVYLNAMLRQHDLLISRGKLVAALEVAREADRASAPLSVGAGDMVRSAISDAIGRSLEAQGDLQGAARAYDMGIRFARSAATATPTSVRAHQFLLISWGHLARLKRMLGDLKGSLQAGRAGVALGLSMSAEDPESLMVRRNLILLQGEVGDSLDELGRSAEAVESLTGALRDCRVLVRGSPSDLKGHLRLAAILDRLGLLEARRGRLDEAIAFQAENSRVCEGLVKLKPESREVLRSSAIARERQASLKERRGDIAAAKRDLLEALALRDRLVEERADRDAALERTTTMLDLAEVLDRQEDSLGALSWVDKAIKARRSLLKREPLDSEVRHGLGYALMKRAEFTDDPAAARAAIKESDAVARQLLKTSPGSAPAKRLLSTLLAQEGKLDHQDERLDKARANFQAALALRRELLAVSPGDRNLERGIATLLSKLADLQRSEGNEQEARATYRAIVDQQRAVYRRDLEDGQARRDLYVGLVKLADIKRREVEESERREAVALLTEAEGLARAMFEQDPANMEALSDLLGVLTRKAQTAHGLQESAVALAAFKEAAHLTQRRLGRREDPVQRKNLSALWLKVADLTRAQGDELGARTVLRKVVANHGVLAESDPKAKAQLGRLQSLLAQQERRCALITGEAKPETAAEHLRVAQNLMREEKPVAALAHYREALRDESVAEDPRVFYEAALAAGQSAEAERGARRAALLEEGLAWLEVEVKGRQEQLGQLADMLKSAPKERRQRLIEFQQGIQAHLDEVRAATRKGLALFANQPRFKALFAKK